MLQVIIKILTSFVNPLFGYIILKDFNNNVSSKYKIVFFIILLSLTNFSLYTIEYNLFKNIINYIINLIVFKKIFKNNMMKSIIYVSLLYVLLFVGELLCSIIFVFFVDINLVRSNFMLLFLTNILVCIIAYLISILLIFKTNIKKIVNVCSNNFILNKIIFLAFTIISLFIIIYLIYMNFGLNKYFYLFSAVLAIFVVLIIILFKENYYYDDLNNRFNILFDYVQEINEIIEHNNLLNHEYKNQLATIRNLNDIKNINNYIDKILNINFEYNNKTLNELNKIPKGPVKGLLYYKLIIAKNNNLNIMISIGKNVNKVNHLKLDDLKNISNLLGIYLDNAIEAAQESENKNISFEMYQINNKLYIVISNSISSVFDISKIYLKGFSSKGLGRGNGLAYSKRILENLNYIEVKEKIIDNYFIKTIIFSI